MKTTYHFDDKNLPVKASSQVKKIEISNSDKNRLDQMVSNRKVAALRVFKLWLGTDGKTNNTD